VETLIVYIFLGTFAKLRKATISFVMFVRPSVRPSTWNNSPPNGRIFHEMLYLSIFQKTVSKFK